MSQNSLWNNIVAICILFAIWQFLSMYISVSLILPDVYSVISALIGLFCTIKFWNSFAHTIITLLGGYIIGLFLTFSIVVIIIKNIFLQRLFEKYSTIFMPMPSFVVLPFISLFFGLSLTTVYIMIVWSVLWISGIQILRAIQNVSRLWEPHVKNIGWSFGFALRHVYLPAAISNIIGIISTSWANSWRILISIETVFGSIGGYFGLGSYIMDTKSKLDVDQMYATLFVIATSGVIIDNILKYYKNKYSY